MREGISNSFGGVAAKATAVLGGVGLVAFAKDSLMLASDLNEVSNVVDVTFGSMATKINDFAKTTSSQFGMSELQAKKFSGTLGAMMKSSGISGDQLAEMSTSLTGLAGDMASFYNLAPDEAFEKIKSAIGGETEPMKALGVNMSVTNMEAFALTQGIKKQWKEMSQAEQTTLRYKYMLQATKDAQGDYAKTSQGFANQLRTLKLNFQTLGANIMAYALPSFEKLFQKINAFVSGVNVKPTMDRISAALGNMGQFALLLGKNMAWVLPIVAGVLAGFMAFLQITKIITVVKGFSKAILGIGSLLNPISLIAAGIGLLVMGMITAYKNSSTFREKIDGLLTKFQGFGDFLGQVLPGLIDKANLFFIDKLCPTLAVLGDFVENTAAPAIQRFGQAFIDLATTIWQNIQPAIDWITKNVTPDLWQAVGDKMAGILDIATNVVKFITDNWPTIQPIILTIVAALEGYKLALIAIDVWTAIVAATTAIFETIELAVWGVVNATSAWEAVQWLLNIAMDANPVGVVIMAIAALGLAIYELITHWQDVYNWIQWVWKIFEDNPILGFISFAINPLGTALLALVANWDKVTGAIKGAWDWFNSWIDKWNGTKLDDKTVTINQNTKAAYDVDPLTGQPYNRGDDTGSNATGTNYWKGGPTTTSEHGDEIINLPSGSQVLTASQSKKVLGNRGGHVFNINFNGNVGTEEFFDQAGEHIINKINIALANV